MNATIRNYEEAFAFYAPIFTAQYAKASRAKCEYAIEDINATLKLHERGAYTGKLYAELDAARTKLQQYRNKSRKLGLIPTTF